eukprot:scaffold2348_cov114-Isochrysis_galbana.AAC.3
MFRTWPVAMEVRHVAGRAGEASQQFQTQMRQSSDPETSLVPVAFQEMVFTHLHSDERASRARRVSEGSAGWEVVCIPGAGLRTRGDLDKADGRARTRHAQLVCRAERSVIERRRSAKCPLRREPAFPAPSRGGAAAGTT